jgi:hypothetical protein
MSQLRFVIHDRSRLPGVGEENGYLAGLDLNPWNATWEISEEGFSLVYDEEDSPKFHQQVIGSTGQVVTLVTSTLKPAAEPHQLWLELARGTVDRLRNRVAAWQVNGMVPSDPLAAKISECCKIFCTAIGQRSHWSDCERLSIAAIDLSLEAMDLAVAEYLRWVSESGPSESVASTTLCGTWLGDTEFGDAQKAATLSRFFNTAAVAVNWKEIQPQAGEWDWSALDEKLDQANQQKWNVVLGPLLRFQRQFIPDWVFALHDDFTEIRSAIQQFVTQVVKHCASKVDLCVLASSINLEYDTGWSGSTRLQLIIDAALGLRRAADNLPFIVGVSQPFSESQRRGDDYPILHLADGLLRANIDLCGFALELDFGLQSGRTWPRDPCQLVERLVQWSTLGLPIVVTTSQSVASDGASAKGDGLRDFPLWLKLLDRTAAVHAVFWSPEDAVSDDRHLLDSAGAPTEACDWIRRGFDLPE